MWKKIGTILLTILLLLNGLLFVSNIYVFGNRSAAIAMHEDLAPTASMMMVNAKVLVCFIAGALYIITAVGILRKAYRWALAGVIAFLLFDGLYIVELALWWRTNSNTWLGFGIFGTLSLLFGVASWRYWQQRDAVLNIAKTA